MFPSPKHIALSLINRADHLAARGTIGLLPPKPALTIFFFHTLFKDRQEARSARMFPHEGLTVAQFRTFVQYFHQAGYRFVSPQDVLAGLDPEGHFVMITFDDGYYNNQRALPVLQEVAAPATFCIATRFLDGKQAFWWDVHYRERKWEGWKHEAILAEQNRWKGLPVEELEENMLREFGKEALDSLGEVDRPFSRAELAHFSRNPLVHLANHTHNHAILPHYGDARVQQELKRAQEELGDIMGRAPLLVAYPNGDADSRVAHLAEEAGLRMGVTGSPQRHFLHSPLPNMELGRVSLHGYRSIRQQCEQLRSDWSLKWGKGIQQLSRLIS